MKAYHQKAEDVLKALETDQTKGLSTAEVEKQREAYGANRFKEEARPNILKLALHEAKEFLNLLLVIAAIVSIVASGHLRDGLFILAVVLFNITLSVVQTRKAENAVAALQAVSTPHAKVIRDGNHAIIDREDVVVGDILTLEAGDYVPADTRLIEAKTLKVDESTLTGESVPVDKDSDAILSENTILAERVNMAFGGTLVTYGRGLGVVTSVGMESELGSIARLLGDVEDTKTPLQKKVGALGKMLGIISVAVVIILFIVGLIRGMEWIDIFMVSVSLAVAAIPEGLPAVITVILALGMRDMANKHAIVKSLSAVETLGSVTVIASDKTGTLTENKMTVREVYTDQRHITIDDKVEASSSTMTMLLEIGALCNDANKKEGGYMGDPTETALLALYEKTGEDLDRLRKNHPRTDEMPFDSERKRMSTKHAFDSESKVLIKGAPESLIRLLTHIMVEGEVRPFTEDDKEAILKANGTMTQKALRVLAFAYKEASDSGAITEDTLTFVGLAGMIDPPREAVKASIRLCHGAGIRVVMITGDHKHTATAIARDLGIAKPSQETLDGEMLEAMSDEALYESIPDVNVFARVSPVHKVRILKALQRTGEIPSMTGDGVNDAPALKQADIGVAMGTGTDVSKEAADMVLTDDNFISIVNAVESGRVIYQNIRKFVGYLISCNIGEVTLIFIAILIGWGSPLLPLQILWVNLVTDTLPAFALGLEKKESDVMNQPPIDTSARIIDKRMGVTIAFQSVFLAAAVLLSFRIGGTLYGRAAVGTTFAFITLITGELLRTFSARSETKSVFAMNPFSSRWVNLAFIVGALLLLGVIYIPGVNTLFRTDVGLTLSQLSIALGLGFIPVFGGELSKIIKRKM
ncbi:MAG: calcium-translocating P-type ATPase, PMCA-type [Candidatus Izemoplasmataceae bacterium]